MSTTATTTASNAPLTESNSASLRLHILVWILFVFSGACGLIYEVLWCRQLGLLFGNTAHSLSTVLTAFMGGLAIGSFVSGRLSHKIRRPFMVYGILEVAIGVYCAILPVFFGESSPLIPMYKALYGETGSSSLVAVRLIVSLLLLMIPTIFMGATLPLLTHFLARSRGTLGRTVGTLYALNSFGAVLGAAGTGFILLPLLGKIDTNWLAVATNILLGVFAILLGAKERMPESAPAVSNEAGSNAGVATPAVATPQAIPLTVRLTVLTFGLTGFAAMVTQIGWTKAISLGTGSSTYAFSLIVAVFIMGLSFGGAWGARRATQVPDPLASLARCLVQIGLMCLIVSTLMGFGPLLFYFLIAWSSQFSWHWVLLGQALGVALLIGVPTFLMGATMPFTMQVVQNLSPDPARTTGTVYAINTLGAIIGSALGGLVLIPLFQIQASLEFMALLYAIPGMALFWLSPSRTDKKMLRSFAMLAVVLVGFLWVIPPWDKMLMSSGIYLMRDKSRLEAARQGRILDALPKFTSDEQILYYREGVEATVAVWDNPYDRSLRVGGKPDATAFGDLPTQVCLTLVPQMLHATGGKEILVIGLGSGVSAGAALSPEGVERVDVVEMSPEVVHGSAYFADVNKLTYKKLPDGESWIDTPRMDVIVNDGRNHLLLTNRQYDIIASEPSNPWMAGVGNLFTREAFKLARSRLRPGGVMCQWIHNYSLDASHVLSIVRSFGEVFPNMTMWNTKGGDFLLIGSESPLVLPIQELRRRMAQPGVRPWLERMHYDTEEEFLATLLSHDSMLRQRSAKARLHTDDNMLLEFDAPKTLFGDHQPFRATSNAIFEYVLDLSALQPEEAALLRFKLDRATAAREHQRAALAQIGDLKKQITTGWVLAPNMYGSLESKNAADEMDSERLLAGTQNDPTPDALGAVRLLENAQKRSKYMRFQVQRLHSARMKAIEEALARGNVATAKEQLAALEKDLRDPLNVGWANLYRAQIAEKSGDYKTAIEQARAALNNNGDMAKSAELLHRVLTAAKQPQDALQMIQEVNATLRARNIVDVELALLEAKSLYDAGNDDAAIALAYQIATKTPRGDARVARIQAQALRRKGRLADAIKVYQTWTSLEPDALAPRIEHVQTMLVFAEIKAKEGKMELALDLLRISRRGSVEAAVLHPDATEPWLVMARVCKALMRLDPLNAKESEVQARQAAKKLLLHVGGNKSDLPPDVTDLVSE